MKIAVRNFICYPTLSLQLDPRTVHLFTGATGSGKSTILDAITWASTGLARGFTKKSDSSLFKIDPTKPMTVRIDFDRVGEMDIPWPVMVNRTTSKFTVNPAASADAFKARGGQIGSCLSAWSLLSTKSADRAAMMSSITTAAGFDPAALLIELRKECNAPDMGAEFNDQLWGSVAWPNVAGAEAEAINIRKSYFGLAKGDIPALVTDRIAEKESAIIELEAALKSGDDPEALTKLRAKVTGLQEQIEQVPKPKRASAEPPVKDADFQELKEQHEAATTATAKLTYAIEEIEPFVTRIEGEYEGDVVGDLVTWLAALKKRLEKSAESLVGISQRKTSLTDKLEQWRTDLQKFTDAESKRDKLGKQITAAEKAVDNWVDPRRSEITAMQSQIDADNDTIKAIGEKAEVSKQKRTNWDKIAKALAPDGSVATALMQEASGGISTERIEWASDELGLAVKIGHDGTIQINSLSERQPSRGQRMLAGLVLQDAFCQAFDIPLMLVDELESLSPECLEKAVAFLVQIADDYELVAGCLTGGPANFRYDPVGEPVDNEQMYGFPEKVSVYHCQGGTVQACPDPSRS